MSVDTVLVLGHIWEPTVYEKNLRDTNGRSYGDWRSEWRFRNRDVHSLIITLRDSRGHEYNGNLYPRKEVESNQTKYRASHRQKLQRWYTNSETGSKVTVTSKQVDIHKNKGTSKVTRIPSPSTFTYKFSGIMDLIKIME